ncbi:hypothetical protein VD0002_g7797 [Verticillium dahliae]|uniref:Uncharacterized protein n=1 Tax=Verticillium dahliae TaxID=27337 RepID=A0A2J8DTH1_VERDA|nr:hypothetical protein BJF96_g7159 [Verticillium dahliae]PNH52574.1 hypothetical protein VD0003_g4740 [Verticillium dahliae]PNH59776.1 hypothetical protein VD0002_g7797 [Verticillium dahliae]RBQ68329.1 hypothetical protein VDGD_08514 [Verticillium dahliae]
MLVTRHIDTESSHWSFNKFETTSQKPSRSSSRMSNHLDAPLSTQPDWQGQYSYLAPESSIFSQPYEARNESAGASQPRSTAGGPGELDVSVKPDASSPEAHPKSLEALSPVIKQRSPSVEQPEQHQLEASTPKAATSPAQEPHSMAQDSSSFPMASTQAASAVQMGQEPASSSVPITSEEETVLLKEEDDDVFDDDDMDGDENPSGQPQTAAERTAQRRKMKRFRLTHQQTRFLMSEFAKQPHPDAAHRERLSREIPGLSPRQVQVWFQNRRAKIKRLTADDRDRMIKMRAVPDDFDNVQALHSPYGAVHALGAPMASPVEFGSSAYTDHMMRPLMVDVRRSEAEDHMSPTGLSPAFGNIGFSASASLSNSDILSPMSPTANDHRYGYSSHLSPTSAGHRPTNAFGRQTSLDQSMMHGRQHARPLQPLHLRETLSRSRSDNLQSPLRSGMSWKGDSIDYTTYAGGSSSPQMSGRQQSVYQPEQLTSGTSGPSGIGYDSASYSSHASQSPPNINYSSYQPSSLQSTQNRLRNRASSATFPLGLDLRNQYRSSSLHSASSRDLSSATSHFSGTSAPSYTASYPSAPLTAPMDFALPRTPGTASAGPRSGVHDYSMPQMSAPIAPPHDFAQAFQGASVRTPMRDTFTGGHQATEHRSEYGTDFGSESALKRKRSFTMPGGGPASRPGAYGNST